MAKLLDLIRQPIQFSIRTAQKTSRTTIETARENTIQTQVYIGLNDMDTKEQRFDSRRYVSVLKHVCMQYAVPFSFAVMQGGYIHENGEYTQENTIVLTFIGVPRRTIDEIAEDLCVFFQQESVLVTSSLVQSRMVSGTVDA